MVHVTTGWIASWAIIAMGATCSAAVAQQPKDLSGRWELRDRDRIERHQREAPVPERPIPPAGARRRPPERRGGMSEEDRVQLGRLLGMAQPVPAFELQQTDSTLVVTNEDGFSYRVFLDGRAGEVLVADSIRIRTRARWDDGHLVVEYEPTGGGKLTERYALADSGVYLRLEVTVEHARLPRRVWRSRMYRLVPDTASAERS